MSYYHSTKSWKFLSRYSLQPEHRFQNTNSWIAPGLEISRSGGAQGRNGKSNTFWEKSTWLGCFEDFVNWVKKESLKVLRYLPDGPVPGPLLNSPYFQNLCILIPKITMTWSSPSIVLMGSLCFSLLNLEMGCIIYICKVVIHYCQACHKGRHIARLLLNKSRIKTWRLDLSFWCMICSYNRPFN